MFVNLTSPEWEDSELIFVYLELDVLVFVLKDRYLRSLFGIRPELLNCI